MNQPCVHNRFPIMISHRSPALAHRSTAISRVMIIASHQWSGIACMEKALADFCGAKHVVSCASGTDALLMVLMAREVGPGDAVLCPSFTFCATGEAVALTGATPVFVDVDQATFNMDAASLKRGIATAKARAEDTGRDPRRPVRPKRDTRIARSHRPKMLCSMTPRRALAKYRAPDGLGLATATISSDQAACLIRRWRRHRHR